MLCINLLELTIFGTLIGTCLRYYFKEIMTSIVVLLSGMFYTITFSMMIINDGGSFDAGDQRLLDLQYKILPPLVFILPSLLTVVMCFVLNHRISLRV
jgi:hypothetical protein